jgi:hypothetical protein
MNDLRRMILTVSLFALLATPASIALADDVPNRSAIVAWHLLPDYAGRIEQPDELQEKQFDCADQNLYPTHPQQTLKAYHRYEWAEYDTNQLRGSDEACATAALNSSQPVKPCLRAHISYRVVMSDTFMNSCGQFFRGFENIEFLDANESMGTLFSPGRTSYQREHSEFPNDYVAGGTYPVPRTRFLKLVELFNGDAQAISTAKQEALSTHTYDQLSHTYIQH